MSIAGITALTEFWAKCKAAFQDKLVSGTNIKTINNESLLGSGNINISGGGSIDFGAEWDAEALYRAEGVGDYGAMWIDDDEVVKVGGPLPIAYGGTGATSAAQARANLGISSGTTTWYGTCGTTASTAAKVVTCANFALETGAIVAVLFTTANTAATPTLNVNSTGAKTIYVGGGTVNSTTNTLKWSANTLLYFMYDGTYFRYLGSQSAASVVPPEGAGTWYGTSSTASSTAAKASTITNFKLRQGAIVNITFTTSNIKVDAALTLNINSTGAKTVYANNAATSASNPLSWNAGETLTFVYSGSHWYFVSKSSANAASGSFFQATGEDGATSSCAANTITPIALSDEISTNNGNDFTVSEDGGVQIARTGTYRVTASIYVTGANATYKGVYVKLNNSSTGGTGELMGLTYPYSAAAVQCGPKMVELNAGDKLFLCARLGGVAGTIYCSNKQSYLLVERVV